MTDDIVNGKWKQIKGKMRQGWGIFTQDQSSQTTGRRDQLLGKLQEQYGHVKNKVRTSIPGLK